MTAAAIVDVLVEASWRALLMAALAGAALMVWRIRTGATRHAAWSVVVVVMLFLPVLVTVGPQIRVPMPVAVPGLQEGAVPSISPVSSVPPVVATANERASTLTPVSSARALSAGAGWEMPSRSGPSTDIPSAWTWSEALVIVWLIGVTVQLLVLAMGWRLASRLACTGSRSVMDPRVFESAYVSAPCAVGVWRGRILVPTAWRLWSRAQREVVVLHEEAHLRRRDPLVALVARVNRAVFWFHPMAWWLERRIGAAAEQACDEAVLRQGADPQRYASLLVEMAAALRRGGRRVAWHHLGMAGGRQLGRRVDRVLTGVPLAQSAGRAVGCVGTAVVLVGLAIACQPSAAPLREDPEVAATLRRNAARTAEWEAAKAMSLDEAAALASQFRANPDDLAAARRLLTFYRESGQKLLGWNAMVAARRTVLLTLIERHPDANETRWPLTQRLDPEGYAQARTLWLAHTERADVSARVLANAASFFDGDEPAVAERLLIQAETIDAGGPTPRVVDGVAYAGWRPRLGSLYAAAVVGATEGTLYNTIDTVSVDRLKTPFAAKARRILDETKDPYILAAAGQRLFMSFRGRPEAQRPVLPFDPVELGRTYMERALAIDPSMAHVARALEQYDRAIRTRALQQQAAALLGAGQPSRPSSSPTPDDVAGLPMDLRMELLGNMADGAFNIGENREYYDKDLAARDAAFDRARGFAQQALTLADEQASDPRSPGLRYAGHMVMGLLALRDGDLKESVARLTAAADALEANTVSLEDLARMAGQNLPHYLLERGERDSVASFYERAAPHMGGRAEPWKDAAASIRSGVMPRNYQTTKARWTSARN
jgi:beta-lactamase regulating signal transducer with metallopeptidase domain